MTNPRKYYRYDICLDMCSSVCILLIGHYCGAHRVP